MIIVGIDEVGRGCWAGPLVAGAVILNAPISGLRDSKLLTKSARERLAPLIIEQATATGLGWVTPSELDSVGLTEAARLAMSRALGKIKYNYEQIIIDGPYNFLPDYPNVITMVKADVIIPAVSAASIIAKVARDRYMVRMSKQFPNYCFDTHVGYGTEAHRLLLKTHGPCILHRKSYKPVIEQLVI